ncbi:hypothetical protein [Endozoicomonas sp. Mp262]|uniref:hypothetical protein n=1 Tax=Endozoicomonas sp. Mp262 TaxID=2919499 RepID=UPI0021D85256
MYFVIDQNRNQVTVYKTLGTAARKGLETLGGTVPNGGDPVRILFKNPLYGDNFQVLGLSATFRLIAELINSGKSSHASGLAVKLSQAVDDIPEFVS